MPRGSPHPCLVFYDPGPTVAANAVLQDAKLTIIPIAIGILGYTYGALLAVFLLGMLTRSRGRDGANVIAMIVGIHGY